MTGGLPAGARPQTGASPAGGGAQPGRVASSYLLPLSLQKRRTIR